MKLWPGSFAMVVGFLIAAHVFAFGIESIVPGNDGDYLVVGGLIGALVCFILVWFVRINTLGPLSWFALMSYVSLFVGVDSHVAFHNAFGSQITIKAFFTFVFAVFLIIVLLRKNYLERPGH